ncbi:hypothetical protein Y88_3792 [Novosphingobium nitrogenifigens DSM 19370]|uniref:Uncharacterized protein n=1 Tax=Novosphingobium nitrogenifigens DSM 19370 TaxID=983920 RepID=F1ZD32_9SPHN|nr:hypothetical protein Y88_3792 [Novosphingobium nitrogenifigens DSM 19370]
MIHRAKVDFEHSAVRFLVSRRIFLRRLDRDGGKLPIAR